jgi:CBS domain-containing protein
MKVRDIMTRDVVSGQKEMDIGSAAKLMLEGGFGTLPVIDEHGKLAGIITDRDIAMAAALRQRNASHIGVHEALRQTVFTCFAEDDILTALKQMQKARVRRLPVLGEEGHLTGIVSVDDIALRAVGQPDGVSAEAFVDAIKRICSQPPLEPAVEFPDTFVSG